jgi:hypothetical protein
MGRLKRQQVVGGGSTLQRRGYEYREDGSLSGVDDLLTGGRCFDPIGRVTTVRAENWTEGYVYRQAT